MSNATIRAGFTLVGSYFGPWGALIGSFVGALLFPDEGPKGPRLNELNVQHSTVGAPIPIVYGTAVLAGNVIWSGGLVETEKEVEGGGKGGGGATTYSYSIDVAVGICEGPIDGIRRIWADADLIYDASDDLTLWERLRQAEIEGDTSAIQDALAEFADILMGIRAMSAQLNFELYLGTEDQLPDPTIESYEPAGTVPPFRGLAYIVFNDFQLEKYGNRIPNFRFEVYTGAPTECGLYSPGQLQPWQFYIDGATRDPRNPYNSHLYGVSLDQEFGAAKAAFEASNGRDFYVDEAYGEDVGQNVYIHGWSYSSTPNLSRPCDTGLAFQDAVVCYLNINSLENITRFCYNQTTVAVLGYCTWLFNDIGLNTAVHVTDGSSNTGFHCRLEAGDPEETCFEGYSQPGSGACSGGDTHEKLGDQQFPVRRSLQPPDPCALGTPLVGAPGYCVVNGQIVQGITWTQVSGTFKVLQEYAHTGPFGVVTQYPVGPILRNDDPNYNNQAFWEAAYAAAVAAGEPLVVDPVYGTLDGYPSLQSFAYFSECDTVDTECVPMAIIVADICQRAGLRTDTATQIDVSGLTTCVTGYVIGRQMSAREALQPLRMFGLWDAVESDALLKFVERGHALVASLTADDLGAHENGGQAPPGMEVARTQEKDLPRRLRLHFPNFLHDHEVSEQSASRITTEAIDELDVELAVSMEPDTAAQLAEIMLYEAWVSRNSYRFSLDNSQLALEPTDCIEIPVDGNTERVRIVSIDYSIGGILKIDAVRDDDGTYVSTAIATPGAPSGGAPGSSGGGPICPAGVVLLDLPRLRSIDIDAGYYAAIYGLCPDFWNCAELYRSNDGGVTYARVARTDFETTVGEILSITGPATDPTLPGDSPPYDTSNSITVELFEGTLASVTDAQIAVGQNTAAIGVDGRWVIIQFKTAVLDTGDQWTISDIVWGVNETQHLLGTTGNGDTFVLLSDPHLLRIPETPENIGVEKQFKVVSCGESIDAVTEFDFTTWGLSYQRPCPSTVISASTTEPPEDADDGDAYLLPNDTSLSELWEPHGGEIATWSDEVDTWVYCTPAPGTIIHIEGEDSGDPGDDVISPGGGGTPTPAPWTPAIPPLLEVDTTTDLDTAYFVAYTPEGYRKVLGTEVAGGGSGSLTASNGVQLVGDDIQLDINGLTTTGTITPANDKVALWDDSAGAHRGAFVSTLISAATGVALTLVGQSTVVGSAATTITVSGLNLDADDTYVIQLALKNATTGAFNASLFYNSDTTAANYVADVTTNGGAVQANNAIFLGAAASSSMEAVMLGMINRPVTRVMAVMLLAQSNNTSASTRQQGAAHMWATTATNVTGITISSSVANTLDIGSKLTVFKLAT